MLQHQMRVVAERDELNDKIRKLRSFIGGAVFASLDESERARLERQAAVMSEYSDVLTERIANFPA